MIMTIIASFIAGCLVVYLLECFVKSERIKMIIYAVCTLILVVMLLSGCGGWTDWSEEQARRVPIFGEPVDEIAVRDAVATVLGESDMRPFAIWFSDEILINRITHKKNSGTAYLCARRDSIEIYLDYPGRCIWRT